jgi:hypothetical protein
VVDLVPDEDPAATVVAVAPTTPDVVDVGPGSPPAARVVVVASCDVDVVPDAFEAFFPPLPPHAAATRPTVATAAAARNVRARGPLRPAPRPHL